MRILTAVSGEWAHPIETIEVSFNSIQEITTGDKRVWRLANFGSWVSVEIDSQATVVLQRQVVTEFTLLAFLAHARLKVSAKCLLVVDYQRNQS